MPISTPAALRPNYVRVFLRFAQNSLVRAMTFRANFIMECVTSLSWVAMNLSFYLLVFQYTKSIGGWNQYQYFIFLATLQLINAIVEALFMPNAEEFSELVRTGELDFALLKPIDTQFLISLAKIDWSSISNFLFAIALLGYSLYHVGGPPSVWSVLLYPLYIVCGVVILYSVTITLAATTVWLGRNQSIYDFWFYITNFSRYPMEIYRGSLGAILGWLFTFIVPVLVVVNVPARLMAQPLDNRHWPLAIFALFATAASFAASRWLFSRALSGYRSASS